MTDARTGVRRSAVEAGAGRPFRFSLVLEETRGSLAFWLGGRWALAFGVLVTSVFAGVGGLTSVLVDDPPFAREVFVFAAAAMGAVAVALHLRPRTVLFEVRQGTWCWRPRRPLVPPAWMPITEEAPMRIEREILSTVEGWTLYAGTRRLFSYLGDPSIGRSVTRAFQEAGVPLKTVMKRTEE